MQAHFASYIYLGMFESSVEREGRKSWSLGYGYAYLWDIGIPNVSEDYFYHHLARKDINERQSNNKAVGAIPPLSILEMQPHDKRPSMLEIPKQFYLSRGNEL